MNLDELGALLERATPGPWSFEAKLARGPARYVDPHDMGGFVDASGNIVCDFGNAERYYPKQGTPPNADDAALIVWLRNNAADLLALAEAGMGAGWRPIEEATHSEDGVLVCDASKPHPAVGVARLIDGTWRGFDHSFGVECIYPTPSHFMPLPSPPATKEQGDG